MFFVIKTIMNIGKKSDIVEFKKSTGELRQALESMAGILNKSREGTIYFGVQDDGWVVGQDVTDSTIRDIGQKIDEMIEPKVTSQITVLYDNEEDENGNRKAFIKVRFLGFQPPYSCNNAFYIRIGTQTKHLTGASLRNFIVDNLYASSWDSEPSQYGIEEIDDKSLESFYQFGKAANRIALPKYDKVNLLNSLDLVLDNKIKNAASILFGKSTKVGLHLASYYNNDKADVSDLDEVQGNVFNLICLGVDYIMKRLNWRAEFGGVARRNVPEISLAAIREIVANAFAHSVYQFDNPQIGISVHPGVIEIANPGAFPPNMTPEDFIAKNHSSYQRNKLILATLFRCNFAEKSGTGFQRVAKECAKDKIRWSYIKEDFSFQFEFFRNGFTPLMPSTSSAPSSLSKTESAVLNQILSNAEATASSVAGELSLSSRTVERAIASLIKKGYLQRIGNNKRGRYVAAEKGQNTH